MFRYISTLSHTPSSTHRTKHTKRNITYTLTDINDAPSTTDIQIRWGDMDAYGHVNNVNYFRFQEQARIDWMQKLIQKNPHLSGMIGITGIGVIVKETSCKYISPVIYPDTLKVGTRVAEYDEDMWRQEYILVSQRTGKVSAVGSCTVVGFDYKKGTKAKFPEEAIVAMREFERLDN
eukprot:TRINITY_DN3722_c0_g1_i1.p1 TRINITY_DN3722_c0_g1~~TRINITY_DN3722_c0_g1_i1.p1  ORF type:complete len:199 (+),score=24.86 TRINITY_DN3722_c0_g1_i1:67-597(+)